MFALTTTKLFTTAIKPRVLHWLASNTYLSHIIQVVEYVFPCLLGLNGRFSLMLLRWLFVYTHKQRDKQHRAQ